MKEFQVTMPLPFLSLRANSLRRILMLAAVTIAVVALSGSSWATSCSGTIQLTNLNPQALCTVAETAQMQPTSVSLQYLSFASQAQGMVLIYSNSLHTQLADVVTFTDVNGVATISFTPESTLSTNMPVLATISEGNSQGYTFLSLALTNGKTMHVGICSSATNTANCSGGADSLRLSVGAPEPGTFFLFGTGLMGSGFLGFSKGKLAQYFRNLIKS
jgi:hypothetical protein